MPKKALKNLTWGPTYRHERPKGVKDEVKRSEGPPARSRAPGEAPRLLLFYICILASLYICAFLSRYKYLVFLMAKMCSTWPLLASGEHLKVWCICIFVFYMILYFLTGNFCICVFVSRYKYLVLLMAKTCSTWPLLASGEHLRVWCICTFVYLYICRFVYLCICIWCS